MLSRLAKTTKWVGNIDL